MITLFILAILLGILAGTITGLIPGIHINLVAFLIIGISPILLELTPAMVLVVFIVSMAITHTFVDFIPSIFLGAPDEDSALSTLPGHKFLLKGKAYHALVLTAFGGLTALFLIIIFTPIFISLLPQVYPYLTPIMQFILIFLSGYLVFSEKSKKLWALIIFLLSGFLGISSLNLGLREPLLPLLTGLFGSSSLIISINKKTKIPEQKIIPLKKIVFSKRSFFKSTMASFLASPFTAFLPGLGSSQAALIGSEILGRLKQREFLFLLGAINTIVMGLSFVTFYSISKTRTGAAVAISELLPEISLQSILIISLTIIFAGSLAFILTLNLAKLFSRNITKINYSILSSIIIVFLIFFVFISSGFLGFLVFTISTSLGITASLLRIRKTHLMGCLLIPTILFYL